MEEDTEVLDWSNEDDEAQALESLRSQGQQKQTDPGATWSGGDQEEAEDAVSLGGDEDEEVYPYAVAEQPRERTPRPLDSPPRAPSQSRSSVEPRYDSQRRDDYDHSRSLSPRKTEPFQLLHSQPVGKLTHALPPKPSVAPPPYIPPTAVNPGILASSMITRERRANGHTKQSSNSQDSPESLPPDWEARNPRGGDREREVYYYNVRTHETTWARPRTSSSRRSSPSRERVTHHMQSSGARSPVRDLTDENVRGIRKDTRRHVSPRGNLGYGDRHYRPEEPNSSDQQFARHDSLSTSPVSSHMRQSSPSSRVPNEHRGARSPSPPPRRRGRSVERSGRGSRRDISPSATDRTSWRGLPRDDRHARQSPVQNRAWARPRESSPVDADAARTYDKRTTIDRGRRHRADIEPPLPTPQDARNSTTFEFSASSTLSASSHISTLCPPHLVSSRGGGPDANLRRRIYVYHLQSYLNVHPPQEIGIVLVTNPRFLQEKINLAV
ncbi:hypothetical protein EIP86_007331 [Pleurotus ostreatoroseus]|nr:hypothetical protein EIP86_007331 [Pleurotus ostreatoroseus]